MADDSGVVADDVAARVLTAPPTLGPGRLVCVDGPAGSGKTTLAAALAERVPGTQVLHGDELLQGWRGLPGLSATVEGLLRPLAAGGQGTWVRWDWHADGWAETHAVTPGGLLVVEGVGSWAPAYAELVGVLVWVEAESSLRLRRGIDRDGEAMHPHWEQWRRDEDLLFARLGTRAHADLVVSTD